MYNVCIKNIKNNQNKIIRYGQLIYFSSLCYCLRDHNGYLLFLLCSRLDTIITSDQKGREIGLLTRDVLRIHSHVRISSWNHWNRTNGFTPTLPNPCSWSTWIILLYDMQTSPLSKKNYIRWRLVSLNLQRCWTNLHHFRNNLARQQLNLRWVPINFNQLKPSTFIRMEAFLNRNFKFITKHTSWLLEQKIYSSKHWKHQNKKTIKTKSLWTFSLSHCV